jgi:hypothetical protein
VALRLKRHGVTRIRPLQGGLNLWMTRKFAIQELKVAIKAVSPQSATPEVQIQ